MNWLVHVTDPAEKVIRRLRGKDSILVNKAIEAMATDPFGGDIEKLGGQSGVWRRRVGSYRIFYKLYSDNRYVYILEIKRRTSKTY